MNQLWWFCFEQFRGLKLRWEHNAASKSYEEQLIIWRKVLTAKSFLEHFLTTNSQPNAHMRHARYECSDLIENS